MQEGLTSPSHTRLAQLPMAPGGSAAGAHEQGAALGVPFVAAEGGGVERDCGLLAPVDIVFIQARLEPMDNPLGDRWREGRRG